MLSRRSLVHIVDPNELALAEAAYLPFAKQGRKLSEIRSAHVREFAPILAATSAHHAVHELVCNIETLKNDVKSQQYYQQEFLRLIEAKFTRNPRIDDDFVMDTLKEYSAKNIADISNALEPVLVEFTQRTEKAILALNAIGVRIKRPDDYFKMVFRDLQGVYQGDYKVHMDYFLPCERIVALIEDKEKQYREKIKRTDRRDKLNSADISDLSRDIQEFINDELQNFRDRVDEVNEEFKAFYNKHHDINGVKKVVKGLVANFQGEFSNDIKKATADASKKYVGKDVNEFFAITEAAIDDSVRACRHKKTKEEYPVLFRKPGADVEKDLLKLSEKGLVTAELVDFLLAHLNSDFLAGANTYHQLHCQEFLGKCSKPRHYYQLETDSKNPKRIFLRMTTKYFSTDVEAKHRGSEIARTETLLRIEQSEEVSVSVHKSETAIFNEGLREEYLLHRLKKKGGIAEKAARSQALSANDNLVVRQFLQLRPWSDQWSKQLALFNASEDLDELFWRARTDQSFFRLFFNFKRTKNQDDYPNHLLALQKFCQMPDLHARLNALEKHYTISQADLSPAFSTIRELNYCLSLIRKKDWSEIADVLSQYGRRDLMICALNSVSDTKSLRKALSYSGILYSLDANTLRHFALKDESIAKIVLNQSWWRRLWVWVQVVVLGETHWQLPAARLQGHHIAHLWQTYFKLKPFRNLFRNLFKLLDLKRDIFALSRAPSAELRKATSKELFSDKDLAQRVLTAPVRTIEAANARLNIISDLDLGLSYEDRSLTLWPDYFQFGIAEPQGDAKGTYSVADDKTVEDHYYNYFLGLVRNSQDHQGHNRNIQDEIVRLWNGRMRLPERKGIQQIAKNAMKRVIRDQKVPLLFNGISLSFYQEVFQDPYILRNFVEDARTMGELKKPENKKLRRDLRTLLRELVLRQYQMSQQCSQKKGVFKLSHLDEVNSLFNVEEDEIYKHPECCSDIIHQVLHHFQNFELMSGFPIDQTDEKKVLKLLVHADPMDLLEFLMRHSGVRKHLNIQEKENRLLDIDRRLKEYSKNRGLNKVEIKTLEDQRTKHVEDLIIRRNIEAFFTHAVNLIKANKKGLLEKIDPDYLSAVILENPRLINSQVMASLPAEYQRKYRSLFDRYSEAPKTDDLESALLVACTDSDLRQKVWAKPALQKQMASSANFTAIFSFFRATNFNLLEIKSSPILNWESAFLKLLTPDHEALLSQHWTYLLENVPGFAAWVLYQLSRNKELAISDQKLKDLTRFKIVGADFLKVLEREYSSGHAVLRSSLLDDPALLPRLLRNLRFPQNNEELASRLVRVLGFEIERYRADRNPRVRELIAHLMAENNIELIVNHADANHLMRLLDLVKRPSAQPHTATDIRTTIVRAIINVYLNREHRRDEMKANPRLIRELLDHSTDSELLSLTAADPSLFEFIVPDLMDRYAQLGNGAIEQLYVYMAGSIKNSSIAYLPRVINNLKGQIPVSVLAQLLPRLINQVWQLSRDLPPAMRHSEVDVRELVYEVLKSTEISLKLAKIDSTALFQMFTQSKDLRAIRLVFMAHPSLGSQLMLECWLNNSASDLGLMLAHQFESSKGGKYLKEKDIRKDLSREMIDSLLGHISSLAVQDRFLVLATDKTFMSSLFQKMSRAQLRKLISSDKRVAEVVFAHFRKAEHREEFVSLLKRVPKESAQSPLADLYSLFSEHPAILQLFISSVKHDSTHKFDTQSFDSVIIDAVRTDADHESVFKILELCYKQESGVFYKNFSVPLNVSKTRIFLLYHLCGGLAMSRLYNRHINDLRDVWKAIRNKFNNGSNPPPDILADLEEAHKAGTWLSFDRLIHKQYRLTDTQRDYSCSRTEYILYHLYIMLRIIKNRYEDFHISGCKAAKHVNQSTPLFYLFEAILNAESRCLQPVDQACTPLQLASLADADHLLLSSCAPMADWLFGRHEKPMDKIMSDPDAFLSLMESPTFQQEFSVNGELFLKVKEFYKRYNPNFVQNQVTLEIEDNACYSAEGDNGMCSVTELRAIMTAREFYDRGRVLHRDSTNLLRDHEATWALFTYKAGVFRIAGKDHQTHAYDKPMPVKYLSRYFYGRFLHKRADFIRQIQNDAAYREAFCQCFQFEWTSEQPDAQLKWTRVAAQFDPQKEEVQKVRYPHVRLSLSGLEPETDLLVMYCFAASLNNPDKNHCKALAAMAQDHVFKSNGKLYFEHSGILVPKACMPLLVTNAALISQYRNNECRFESVPASNDILSVACLDSDLCEKNDVEGAVPVL